MKKVIGVGVMLQTPQDTFLFQKRDGDAKLHPERIAPFGGGIEDREDAIECAKREMREELNLHIDRDKLQTIKLIESQNEPGVFIHMFLVQSIDKTSLNLNEGEAIIELSKEDALSNEKVTDFTKEVLRLL